MAILDYVRGTRTDPYRPYRLMLALDALILVGVLIAHVVRKASLEYSHLLVTYQFGFMKRALIGDLMSHAFEKVSLLHVYALGVAVWLAMLAAYLVLFKRCFGFRRETLPLLAFIVGSPFFLKNLMLTVGYFDLYGCLAAIVVILLPVTALYPWIVGLIAAVLLAVHHIHFLLYLPTIAVIGALRFRQHRAFTPAQLALWAAIGLAVIAVFLRMAFFSPAPVAPEVLAEAMRARALGPVEPRVEIWFNTIRGEIRDTWSMLPRNLLGFPVYGLLLLLHLPLIRFGIGLWRNLASATDRRLVALGAAAITLASAIIFFVVFDYARWVSNWAVCMILLMHTVSLLPARTPHAEPPIEPQRTTTLACAWAVTLIPRVGIVTPF